MTDRRAICDECGHTNEWHDRTRVSARTREALEYERPCYRQIGVALCPCAGFRDSRQVAVSTSAGIAVAAPRPMALARGALLVLLLLVGALAALYAYRSQSPAVVTIPLSQVIAEVDAGQVARVVITRDRGTLELRTGERQQATLPERDDTLARAVTRHNTAEPSRPTVLEYQQEDMPLPVVGSIVLSLLPALLVGLLFLLLVRAAARS